LPNHLATTAETGERRLIFDDLRAIQRQHGYLPAKELQALASQTQTPLYHLQGLATFYPHFRLTPPPAVDVRLCDDFACHLNGAAELRRGIRARLEGSGPAGVVVGAVSCLGRCDRPPAAAVNDTIVAGLTPDSLFAIIETVARRGAVHERAPERTAAPLLIDPYAGGRPYEALRDLLKTGNRAGVLATLKAADLRGLGGAGFPTFAKWERVQSAPGDEKYVVCNADESEPGTIKDRFLMDHVPHLVVEGMIIAGIVTGARTGIIYIRHEYEAQREVLAHELERCRREGMLGSFDISIFVSPGGYICGEETALLEALEGKRAEPRNKPPFPGLNGLYQKPTLINNVETFASVPAILTNGSDWYKARGESGFHGLKFMGVSGHVVLPGVYEVPMGTPVRTLIYERAGGISGGRRLKAFATSGASSGFLPASMVGVALDFKALADAGTMLGSSALVVCAEGTCMVDMALNGLRFFRKESCGKCVPCRVGSAKLVDTLTRITEGHGTPRDLEPLPALSSTLALTSICGLGQMLPRPIESVLKYFADEVEQHVVHHRCPEGVCPMGSRS
jgi:NADH:ubiquinone oxidoreductase subunit F (NADH-binding)